tara:strand:+ start:450 stop:659 length:210 start_codon:yes stop_codon:yes gene_type:complete
MANKSIPLRKSLSYKQAKSSVIVAFIIGIVLSSVQIGLDYFSQQQPTEQRFTQPIIWTKVAPLKLPRDW